jgi:hypothetical protein
MSPREHLHDRLAGLAIGEEAAARERTGRALAAAFDARAAQRPRAARRRRRVTPLAATALALSLTAAALAATGHGDDVTRWIGDLVDPPPARTLERLPAPGRLLTVGAQGATLVDADGDRHGLGRFDDVTWSPHGLYVAGARGTQLAAVDPEWSVHWTLSATARVADPRWGPDGYRIAYRAGRALRVVAGDGTGDHLVAAATAPVAAAWRPDSSHALAFVAAGGGLVLVDADAGAGRRIGAAPARPTWIGWAGRHRLLAAGPGGLALYAAAGRLRAWHPPRGASLATAAVAPGARRIAVLLQGRNISRLALLDARTLRPERSLITFRGAAAGLTWSPDGRWLGTTRPGLGHWLLVPLDAGAKPRALRGLAQPRGWCCAEG